jgi:hypothetical protein
MNRLLCWCLQLMLLGLPIGACANDYLAELVQAAHAKNLADTPQWHALLHYKRTWIPRGVESFADDPRFFNAPNGKSDPRAELEATLTAFFSDKPETPTEQNPQCQFVARYQWLKRELQFDPARLPERPCPRFHEWRAALNAEALTLVFPAAYLNNPASLYGHTLLRVDARDQTERTRLLAYSINYAAATDEANGLAFAVKGIFGGYPGLFSISPYYAKVREYSDLENRDVWEYELNFTQEEIDRLLEHAWEIGAVHFDYYFFDENCSYHLLSLFDVARPSLRLTDAFPLWVIPADTARAVVEREGLLRRVTYRPARSTVLRHRMQHMAEFEVRLAKRLAIAPTADDESALAALPVERQARIVELAYDYLDYERLRGRAPDIRYTAPRLRELLFVRSRLDVADAAPPPVPQVRPDQGHRSGRVSIGIGRANGDGFQEIELRPAYHDLLDPEPGYNRGAQIEFFGIAARHRARDERTRLERLDLINITSISARDELLKPMSWKAEIGFERQRLAPALEPLVFHLRGGAGYAAGTVYNSLWYGMIEAALEVHERLDSSYAVGTGPAIGILTDITDRWRLQLEARALTYALGDDHSRSEIALNQRFTISRKHALRLEWSRAQAFGQTTREAALSWSVYF